MSTILRAKLKELLQRADARMNPIIAELKDIERRVAEDVLAATDGKLTAKLRMEVWPRSKDVLPPVATVLGQCLDPWRDPSVCMRADIFVVPPDTPYFTPNAVSLWHCDDVLQTFDAKESAAADIVKAIARRFVHERETTEHMVLLMNQNYGTAEGFGKFANMDEKSSDAFSLLKKIEENTRKNG